MRATTTAASTIPPSSSAKTRWVGAGRELDQGAAAERAEREPGGGRDAS